MQDHLAGLIRGQTVVMADTGDILANASRSFDAACARKFSPCDHDDRDDYDPTTNIHQRSEHDNMRITLDCLRLPGFREWVAANPQIADAVELVQVDGSLTEWDGAFNMYDKDHNFVVEPSGEIVPCELVPCEHRRVSTSPADPAWLTE